MNHPRPSAFHVQEAATTQRDGFPYFAHHDSVSALWSQKWRPLCAGGIYPFTDANVADLDPVFDELSRISGDDPAILHRPDDYATPFLPAARQLVDRLKRHSRARTTPGRGTCFCGPPRCTGSGGSRSTDHR